jgi:hypothetical protein
MKVLPTPTGRLDEPHRDELVTQPFVAGEIADFHAR